MYNHRGKSFTNAYNKLPVEESHISPPIRFATFVSDINFYYWKKHLALFFCVNIKWKCSKITSKIRRVSKKTWCPTYCN